MPLGATVGSSIAGSSLAGGSLAGGCPNPPCLDANIWRNFDPSLEYVNNPAGNIAGASPSVTPPPATPMAPVDPLTPLGFTTEQFALRGEASR